MSNRGRKAAWDPASDLLDGPIEPMGGCRPLDTYSLRWSKVGETPLLDPGGKPALGPDGQPKVEEVFRRDCPCGGHVRDGHNLYCLGCDASGWDHLLESPKRRGLAAIRATKPAPEFRPPGRYYRDKDRASAA